MSALYTTQQQYALSFLKAHQESSRQQRKQLQLQHKQAQLALLASQLMSHMCTKASALSCSMRQVQTPPSSPPVSVIGLQSPAFVVSQADTKFNQRTHKERQQLRYAPYAMQNSARRSAANLSLDTNSELPDLSVSNTPPLTPSSQSQPLPQRYHSSPSPAIKTTSAESLQIQKIVMTALSTLRLPSHSIIMALFFVHKLLTATITRPSTASIFPSITPNDRLDFSHNPVALFAAGLLLADTMLCDAPVSVSTWSWILSHSAPPFSATARTLYPEYARDVKRWALHALDFDVNVGVEVYGEWVLGVRSFLESGEAGKGLKGVQQAF
ncbi:hypothetical protein BC830DRAFT_580768 [Chytriomyces sp. MP71]|nr:hypothetical protein BC830DRAFT_580768 [Chytriomyces sp. MP71]